MRLRPVAFAMMRHASRPFVYVGRRIQEGEHVIIATTVPHFLAEVYPDPPLFDPERFAAPRNEHKTPFVYAPYGLGPSTCLGARLADIQLLAIIASLVRSTNIGLADPSYELRIAYAPSAMPSGLRLTMEPR